VQRGFYRIAAVLAEPISLEETLDALAQAAAEALGGASAAVIMPGADDLRLAGLHGLPAPLIRFLEEDLGGPDDPLRACARRRRVLAAPRLGEDDRFDERWQRIADECGYRSLLAAPVEAPRSEEGGLVLVFFAEERRFADDDLELARNLTAAARGALERSGLFEGERRSRALAQQLARTTSFLAPELDPAVVLDEVVRRAPELLSADAALSSAELYQNVALEKERSVAILSNIADGIVAVDREGKVVLWNAAAEEITGVPTEEALGLAPAEVLQRDLESPGDTPTGERLVSIRRGGEEIWLSLTEAVMRDPAGAVAGRIFAFRDISAERVVEQMKREFVSNVSRELRSPLTSIYGFAETLLRDDVLFGEEERETFLRYIT